MSHDLIEKLGERWDENEPAMDLYERWRKADKSTKVKAALHLLTDSGTKGSNELARAAAVLVMREHDMPVDVIRAAWVSHKFILKDHAWLDTFPNTSKAHELIRQETMQLKDKILDRTGGLAIDASEEVTAAVKVAEFDEFICGAVKTLIFANKDISAAFSAAVEAIKDASINEKSVTAVASVLRSVVAIAVDKIYNAVASGEIESSKIFSEQDIFDIASQLASDFIAGKLS